MNDPSRTDQEFQREALADFDVLYRVAVQLAADRDLAKELVQAAVLGAYRRWWDRGQGLSARAWILCILVREARRRLSGGSHADPPAGPVGGGERESWLDRPGDGVPLPGGVLPQGQTVDTLDPARVRAAIDPLPYAYREVLALSDIAGLSYDELAVLLDCPRDAARTRLYEARAALKARLFP
ncbi:MAG: RNA polymerase sigma factor [Gemmatimonadetes bacterium]|nr:MAG: RNA polymerase sigma factor [Gemmatimonadota bacterium]